MEEKYIKRERKVITYNTIALMAYAAQLGVKGIADADDETITTALSELPEEINMVIIKDEAEPVTEKEAKECDLIRINALEPKYANYYIKHPLAGKSDLVSRFLIPELKAKNQLGTHGPGGYISVAGLENYPELRVDIEKVIGIKNLYTEVRKCTDAVSRLKAMNRKGKGTFNTESGGNISVNGCYEIEMIGNFKNSRASLYKAYTLDTRLRKMLKDDVGLLELSQMAVNNKLVEKQYPDSPYVAVATYYGCINTDDGLVNYESFKPMTKGDYAMVLARMVSMDAGYDKAENPESDSFVAYKNVMDKFGISEQDATSIITRYEALEFASKNFGPDAVRMIEAYKEKAELSGKKGSNCFTDIAKKSEYDNYLVAAFYMMRAIDSDETQQARLSEELTMSKGLRLLFDFLEAYTNIELLNTEFIQAESGIAN